jgi:L-fucose isomerase-like protein
MGKRVCVAAVGSPVHPQMQRTAILKRLLSLLEDAGFEVDVIAEPVSSFDEAWAVRRKVLEVEDSLAILHLTGGTSKLAVEVAKWCNAPVTLVAHGENNSLPSSLEARARLERLGLNVEVKVVEPGVEVVEFRRREVDFEGCVAIIGEVSPRTFDVTCPAALAQRLNVRVRHVTQDELERYVEKHKGDAELFSDFLSKFKGEVGVPPQELQLSLALKEAISEIVKRAKCDAFTIDCFEVIKKIHATPCLAISLLFEEGILGVCEADVQAMVCMMAIKSLAPPFMGNIAATGEDSLTLAHCTAAINLASSQSGVKLKSHFETGRGVAVDVPLKLGEATMIACDHRLKEAYVVECSVERSQLENKNMCRTQALVKLKTKPSKVLARWPGGHAVLAIRVSSAEAKRALKGKGFEVEEI